MDVTGDVDEGNILDSSISSSTSSRVVQKEFFRTERLEQTQRKVPEEVLNQLDSSQLNPADLGPPDMTSSSYTYSYETQLEPQTSGFGLDHTTAGTGGIGSAVVLGSSQYNHDPHFQPSPHGDPSSMGYVPQHHHLQQDGMGSSYLDNVDVERHSTQTQKVTKVTRVVTTRTVEQVPVDGDEGPEYVASEQLDGVYQAQQASVSGDAYLQSNGMGEVGDYASRYALPSGPGAPQLVDVDVEQVTLAWLRPDYDGDAGPIVGYVVESRMPSQGQPDWLPAHHGLITDTQVTVTGLRPHGEYEFRVVAKNPAGFGQPSTPAPLVQLRPKYAGHQPPPHGHVPSYGSGDGGALSGEEGASLTHFDPQHGYDSNVPYPPGRPQAVDMDRTAVTVAWEPPISAGNGGPVSGYHVEYRQREATDWMLANDYLIQENRFTVRGLRPNGEYEFRVLAKNADGFSAPSQPSGYLRIKPMAPPRLPVTSLSQPLQEQEGSGSSPSGSSPRGLVAPLSPSQPQVTDVDSDFVTLLWAPPATAPGRSPITARVLGYLVQSRELGDPNWQNANEVLTTDTQMTVERLNPNSTYEFRVLAKNMDGWSEPSEVSEVVQLRPKHLGGGYRSVPMATAPPEILESVNDTVTLCWAPARSSIPVQGYQVELREGPVSDSDEFAWQPVNQILCGQCKLGVSNLLYDQQYEFRVIAKNAIGYSEPSAPSVPVIIGQPLVPNPVYSPNKGGPVIGPVLGPDNRDSRQWIPNKDKVYPLRRDPSLTSDISYNGQHPPPTLPDEIKAARESPPITDTDDSPPPIRRPPFGPGSDELQWRDPTLPEVLEYLSHPNNVLKQNATGYLQHLTYHDDVIKQKVRELDGIPKLVKLLESDFKDIQRNAAGCLRNLSYGKQNDENKSAIKDANGISALASLLIRTNDLQVQEEVASALYNLSSIEEFKKPVLEFATEPLIHHVVIPQSGWSPSGNYVDRGNPTLLRNALGVLRNVSSAGEVARRRLRERDGLVDSLFHFLNMQLDKGEYEDKSVENLTCVLRNLSYRIQEVEEPDYDKKGTLNGTESSRSKSAPSGSPKVNKPKKNKKKGKETNGSNSPFAQPPVRGMQLLWQPAVVKTYFKLLRECSNYETIEASAGAIQNLAGCFWQPSLEIRATVRQEKGLPILVELLRVTYDRVVCAVSCALRNLALDPRNKELIGKYAMTQLVEKLPADNVRPPEQPEVAPSDHTITAVLSLCYEIVLRNVDFAKSFHEAGGTARLLHITKNRSLFSPRVVRYAAQVLVTLYQHKELHDLYRKAGYKDADFITKSMVGVVASGRDAGTLGRPINTQGGSRGRPQSATSSTRSPLPGRYQESTDGSGGSGKHGSRGLRPDLDGEYADVSFANGSPVEPVYAQVQKGGGRPAPRQSQPMVANRPHHQQQQPFVGPGKHHNISSSSDSIPSMPQRQPQGMVAPLNSRTPHGGAGGRLINGRGAAEVGTPLLDESGAEDSWV